MTRSDAIGLDWQADPGAEMTRAESLPTKRLRAEFEAAWAIPGDHAIRGFVVFAILSQVL
jgi:hypothetical protein